jgi:phosphohistidine swiveling domain-containing protein
MPDLSSFKFGTKAETLDALNERVTSAIVPQLAYYDVQSWRDDPRAVLNDIGLRFGTQMLIVRSSALTEDQAGTSMAGYFESLPNIPSGDKGALSDAIDKVVASMSGNGADQVLIQKMVVDQVVSGVIMTFDVARGAPYYCIDFDDESGRTDVVTSGSGVHKSLYVHRDAPADCIHSERVTSFLTLARELEQICECAAIDIEFGMDKTGQLYLFQVRRIVLASSWHPVVERRVRRQLSHVKTFLEARSQRRDGILGDRSIFAVMPDWNPAEIIGTTPRPLAASLYMGLITDSVWSRSRAAMGYRDLGDTDLMVVIANHSFIDVRHSFNSLIPASVPDDVGETLVNAWMDRLETHPELHDKIEFDIVPTCHDFAFDERFHEYYPGLLSDDEFGYYRDALRMLTARSLAPGDENSLRVALKMANRLQSDASIFEPTEDPYKSLDRARSLLEVCREKGTLPFAIAARHAFISEALLRSAVYRGAITEDRLSAFKRTIRTKSGSMVEEYSAVCAGELDVTEFNRKYGHLRPGTYEITSLRYDEREDLFQSQATTRHVTAESVFSLTDEERAGLEQLLKEAGLDVLSADQLLDHAATAIVAREDIKFEFTRVLSDAMSHILKWGNHHGLSRDDLSFLEWEEISRGLKSPLLEDLDRHFLDIADDRRRKAAMSHSFKLAHIIAKPKDIYVATLNRSMPNFVGTDSASGRVVQLQANSTSRIDLEGCIVCIENADPGFDWIFTKNPGGLVTRFGGANSHMAVRCAELGIPAAIGCGDQTFERISRAIRAELNCGQHIVRPLHG